jgi:EAL and modified HD-GYP domain-containing signal transduction protein
LNGIVRLQTEMPIASPELKPFPLAGLQVVANAHNKWMAVALQLPGNQADAVPLLSTLFGSPDVLTALAPLDCIVPIRDPRALTEDLLRLLPARRILFSIPAAQCPEPQVRKKCAQLAAAHYRILIEGPAGFAIDGGGIPGGGGALSFDCSDSLPEPGHLLALPGPHLARHVHSAPRLEQCLATGFAWFAGSYALDVARKCPSTKDSASRQRLLSLLGLLARDADSRDLEIVLKQDPVLSYHLLKLVNSAAFAPGIPIWSFGQAISLLGRRQLQRWLQLLLYARQSQDGVVSALLPLAAMRGALMEALCRVNGDEPEQQEKAFVAGVFSLLDILLGMPMRDIIGVLNLDDEIVAALLERSGPLGAMLVLAEAPVVSSSDLERAGIEAETYWNSLLDAYRWAILVGQGL